MIKMITKHIKLFLIPALVLLLIIIASLCVIHLFTSDSSENVSKVYSREQIARQNIFTLFRWIENGSLDKPEVDDVITAIKKQVKVLKNECSAGRASCAAVYGYLDGAFFGVLKDKYEFMGDNRRLLNNLFVAAGGDVNPVKPRHPWLDIKNNLSDCLENELIICCSKSPEATKADLTKPEIFVAPDVDSVVSLLRDTFTSVLKTRLSLSGDYRLVHTGSTSHGTSLDNVDFDFSLVFENPKDVDLYWDRIDQIIRILTKRWKTKGYNILSKGGSKNAWGRLISLLIQDKDGIVFKFQVSAGNNVNLYPDNLSAQIEQIKALGSKWEDVQGQIILFKRLVRDVLGSYGKTFGGLNGPGCEQFIIQADSSTDYGKKLTSIGSFDKAMRWVYNIGFDRAASTVIPFNKVVDKIGIYYQDARMVKPLVCEPVFWGKLVNAAAKYVELNKLEMSEEEFAQLGLPIKY